MPSIESRDDKISLTSEVEPSRDSVEGMSDRLNAPLDKAEHLLRLANLASAAGDFRLAARLYEDAKKWTAFALRDGQPPARGE